jgi:N-acetylglutamate synthase-like GNAT family acetyltransferase
MMSPLLLRPARDTDARAVVDLLAEAHLNAAFDPREFRVAEEDGRVVACARLRDLGGAHELASVAVAPARRRLGVGERLVRETLRDARGPVFALALAPAFFERLGFRGLADVPEALRERAARECAKTTFVPMELRA